MTSSVRAPGEESQARRIARQKRTELLDAAVAELLETGWRGLQMQAVATRVGVSRQTVYNTFGSRDGLAGAMVEHLTDSFLDGFEEAFAGAAGGSVAAGVEAGVRYALSRASGDPALRAMLGLDADQPFLELLTSGSAPIVTRTRERIPAWLSGRHPELDPARLTQVAELLARLTLSEIVQPVQDADAAAAAVTEMVTGYLGITAPHTIVAPASVAAAS